jgi:hypothetical protein
MLSKKEMDYAFHPEELASEQVSEIASALDSRLTLQKIFYYTQISLEKREQFFSDKYAPFSTELIPQLSRDELRKFFLSIAQELVEKWRFNPEDEGCGRDALHFVSVSAEDLFFSEHYINNLLSLGYEVNVEGIVIGTNREYLQIIMDYAKEVDFNLVNFQQKIGGLEKDILIRALRNLVLTADEISFIKGFFNFYSQTERSKDFLLKKLRIVEQVRRYYFSTGLGTQDLLLLWGFDTDQDEILKRCANELQFGEAVQELLSGITKLTSLEKLDNFDFYQARAKKLDEPTQIIPWEETLSESFRLTTWVANLLRFSDIISLSIMFNGKPGTRSRGVNFSYKNFDKELVTVNVLNGYQSSLRQVKTLGHELTHRLHALLVYLVSHSVESWGTLNKGIKEQLAILVATAVKKNYLSQNPESQDQLQKDCFSEYLTWVQYLLGFFQIRLLQEIEKTDSFTDQQLLAMGQKLNHEFEKMIVVDGGQIEFRLFNQDFFFPTLKLNDGLAYIAQYLNGASQNEGQNLPKNRQTPSLLELMEVKFGEEWLNNDYAFKALLCLMIKTATLQNTTQVAEALQEILTLSEEQINQQLSTKQVVWNDAGQLELG